MKKLIAAIAIAFALLFSYSHALPPPSSLSVPQHSQGNPNVQVWVNTDSGVYHCPGTRWYGKTKQGVYMTQRQAQGKGHRPAYGRTCE
jgi:hypothetical protein